MNEKVSKFYEIVSADDALREELQAVVDGVDLDGDARAAMAEAVAAFAAEHDLDLVVEDVLGACDGPAEGELSDAELLAVSGGGKCGCFVIGAAKGCGCFMYGGKQMGGLGDEGDAAGIGKYPDVCIGLGA